MFDLAKIPAADVWPGIILGLSYSLSGTWTFDRLNTGDYFLIVESKSGPCLHFTAEGIFSFITSVGKVLELNLGHISTGSIPVYINYIRKGQRPNNKGRLPRPVPVSWSRKDDSGKIYSSNYRIDLDEGLAKYMPMWLFI